MDKDTILKLALSALVNHTELTRPIYQTNETIVKIKKFIAESALERMADSARELGLNYDTPPECETEAEKTAFAFGWFKALEHHQVLNDKTAAGDGEIYKVVTSLWKAPTLTELDYEKHDVWINNPLTKELLKSIEQDYTLKHPMIERDPVAWMFKHDTTGRILFVANDERHTLETSIKMNPKCSLVCSLHATPPQRPWVGLTKADVERLSGSDKYGDLIKAVVTAVESELKKRNDVTFVP